MQPKPKPKAKAKKPSKRLEKTYEYFDGMNENTKAIAKLTARMKDFEERLNNLGQHAGRMHIDICNHEKRLAALEGKPAPELPSEKPEMPRVMFDSERAKGFREGVDHAIATMGKNPLNACLGDLLNALAEMNRLNKERQNKNYYKLSTIYSGHHVSGGFILWVDGGFRAMWTPSSPETCADWLLECLKREGGK